ncbi:MAG: hypothetical protein WCI95_09140 [bacterium]
MVVPTAAFLLPPEKALKKTPTLLGAYFLAPSTVCSSKWLMAGELGALPVIPGGCLPFIVVEFIELLIVASPWASFGSFETRRSIIQRRRQLGGVSLRGQLLIRLQSSRKALRGGGRK